MMTATGTSVIALIPRMTAPIPAWSVGSPDPASAMTSGLDDSRSRTWATTASGSAQRPRRTLLLVVRPSWQYTQS